MVAVEAVDQGHLDCRGSLPLGSVRGRTVLGDGERFQRVMRSVVGKRLTYRVLTNQGDAGFMGIR